MSDHTTPPTAGHHPPVGVVYVAWCRHGADDGLSHLALTDDDGQPHTCGQPGTRVLWRQAG